MEEDMRQYEIAIRIAQVHHLAEERKYKKALTVIQTLDMRQVRNISDLKVFAEVYTRTEQFEAAKATYLRIYKKSRTRRILYRLIYLAIRTNELDDAESYYKELEEHGFSFFLSIDENGYSEDVTIGNYPFGYGALYLYKHCTTNEIIAGFWQCS